jgi:acetyl-CoA carboxylase biotin carboxyl carrier protein
VPDVAAHITGTVWKIECAVGDAVREGDTVVVLESMKMELSLTAPIDGTVTEIGVSVGDKVGRDQVVATVE